MSKKLVYGAGGCYEPTNTKADQDLINSLKDPWHSNVMESDSDDDDDDRPTFKTGGKVCGKMKDGGAMKIKISHPGALREKMGVPKGEKIPMSSLKAEKTKAKKTDNSKLMKQVTFAENARKWKKK